MRSAIALTLALTAVAGPALDNFQTRLEQYVKLRSAAVVNAPPLPKKATPAQIQERELALANAIQKARGTAKQGDILSPDLKPVFARLIRTDAKAVKDGNPTQEKAPGEVTPKPVVNGIYPKNAPLSSVPPSLLSRLPKLPPDLEYRFVGRTLILRDAQANIIVDFMPEAAPAR